MTRIRYSPSPLDNTILLSRTHILLPDGRSIVIALNTTTNTYGFVHGGETISHGTAKNLLSLKKLVRSTLVQLGVPLEVEVKKSKKTATEEAA